jgi:hypothetical protein
MESGGSRIELARLGSDWARLAGEWRRWSIAWAAQAAEWSRSPDPGRRRAGRVAIGMSEHARELGLHLRVGALELMHEPSGNTG